MYQCFCADDGMKAIFHTVVPGISLRFLHTRQKLVDIVTSDKLPPPRALGFRKTAVGARRDEAFVLVPANDTRMVQDLTAARNWEHMPPTRGPVSGLEPFIRRNILHSEVPTTLTVCEFGVGIPVYF